MLVSSTGKSIRLSSVNSRPEVYTNKLELRKLPLGNIQMLYMQLISWEI